MLILKNFIFHRNCSDQTNSDQFPIPKKEKEKENLHASRSQVASHHSESATAIILWIRKISKHRNELHRRWTNHSNRRKSPHLAPRLERKILGCPMLSVEKAIESKVEGKEDPRGRASAPYSVRIWIVDLLSGFHPRNRAGTTDKTVYRRSWNEAQASHGHSGRLHFWWPKADHDSSASYTQDR